MKGSTLQSITTTACAVIAAASLAVMGVFVVVTQRQVDEVKQAAADSQEAVDLVVQQRTESREINCLKDQRFAQAHNRLVYALATGAGTHPVRPQDQAALEENTVDEPDCSPKGIKDFYDGRLNGQIQPDGAVGTPFPNTTTTTSRSTVRRGSTSTTGTTATSRPTTSTTFPSSTKPSDPPCELLPGVTVPPGVPCV